MGNKFITYNVFFEDIRNLLCNYGCDIDNSLVKKFKEVFSGYYVFLDKDHRDSISKQLSLSEKPNIILYNRKGNDYTNCSVINLCCDDYNIGESSQMMTCFLNSLNEVYCAPKTLSTPDGIKIRNGLIIYITYTSINIEIILNSLLGHHLISREYHNTLISKAKVVGRGLTVYTLTYERSFDGESESILNESALHLETFIKKEDVG